jgi:hypothetical protein
VSLGKKLLEKIREKSWEENMEIIEILFDKLWNPSNHRSDEKYRISIEINLPVMERIKRCLFSSGNEEGGKFLGKIIESNNQIKVRVFSFIDAGPKVQHSPTHLIPDGDHQEYLFRIIENLDSDIDIIGSWHSHHPNGLQDLSNGDLNTYFYYVNNKNYYSNWFFVMLITKITDQVEAKFYLFHRGDDKYYQIPENRIIFSDESYEHEAILREAEKSALLYRNQRLRQDHDKRETRNKNQDDLENVRVEDKNWLDHAFPSAQLCRNKKNHSLFWRWYVNCGIGDMEVKYIYPEIISEEMRTALLSINCGGKEILHMSIKLDQTRFQTISNEVVNARYRLEGYEY